MCAVNYSANNVTYLILFFTNTSITIFGYRNISFSTIDLEVINFHTFNENSNEIISIQNTFWENVEMPVFNETVIIVS